MANTVFKLRRSSVAGKVPNTSTLSIGELGLNLTDQKIFSSDGSSVFELGANLTTQYVYSTLSVGNSSVNTVINSTSINVKSIIANGSVGSANQVLTSNGTGTYWSNPTGGTSLAGGSNTQIQFNDSGTANGSANFTIDKSTNTIYIGSSTNNYNTYFGNSSLHGYVRSDLQNKNIDFGVESSNSVGYYSSYFYLNGTIPQMWAYAGPSDGSQMYIDFYVVGQNGSIGSATLESVYYKQFGADEKNILNRFISNSTTSYYESSYSNTSDGIYNSVITVTNSSVSSITLGNSSVNTAINSTSFSGTANNSNYIKANTGLVSNSLGVFVNSAYINTISSNLAYYVIANSGIVSNSSGVFVNTSYIATLTANNTSFVGSVSAANVVSNAQLSANLSNYQTTVGLSGNVATLTANNTSFVGSVSAANVVSNAQLSANLSNYQTTAGLSANVATLTANAATYATSSSTNTFTIGTAAYHVSNGNFGIGNNAPIDKLSINGTTFLQGNVIFGNSSITVGLQANGSYGTAGQLLTSNGTATYWSTGVAQTSKIYSKTVALASQNTFTTSTAFTAGAIDVYVNGVHLANSDYTEVNSTTVQLGFNCTAGQIVEISGYAPQSVVGNVVYSAAVNVFNGTGAQTIFGLTTSNVSTQSAFVFINGVLQNPSNAYSISANVITFTTAPSNNDLIEIRIPQFLNANTTNVTAVVGNNTVQFTNTAYIVSNNQTANTFTQTIIDTFDATLYRTSKYLVQVTDNNANAFQSDEILIVHDGTTSYIILYGEITTNTQFCTFDTSFVSNNVNLLLTTTSTNTTTKIVKTLLTV